ncbi:MAG: sulfatase-like hydrolase/transferase [Candidatus Hydrogenedentota bacterium]
MNQPQNTPPKETLPLQCLHLITLSALAVSPLYTTLQANPAYFIANDIWPGTIYTLIVGLSIGIPAILCILLLIASRIHERLRQALYLLLMAGLFTISFMPLTSRLTAAPWPIGIILAISIGIALTRLLLKNSFVSIGIAAASPVACLFPLLFLVSPGLSQIVRPSDARPPQSQLDITQRPPIVMLVFDEFPALSLLDAKGKIDPERYPSFASLANESTWYPYATTVHDYTLQAVPAILSGNYPEPGPVLPLRRNYPDSLFSELEHAYTLHTLEQVTSLAPETNQEKNWHQNRAVLELFATDLVVLYLHAILPNTLANRWVPIEKNVWGGLWKPDRVYDSPALVFGELERMRTWHMERLFNRHAVDRWAEFDSYLNEIPDYPKETFHLLHTLLPHSPWEYFPSGRRYNTQSWPRINEGLTLKRIGPIHQRAHLVQAGFADRVLGQLIEQLKDADLYKQSILVIVADHGVNYLAEGERRILFRENFAPIAFVPLFIKIPGQTEGVIDRSNVQVIDIAPTILDILMDGDIPTRDGRSLINASSPEPLEKTLTNRLGTVFSLSKSDYMKDHQSALQNYSSAIGMDSKHFNLYNAANAQVSIGTPDTNAKHVAIPATINCPNLQDPYTFDPESPFVSALFTGSITLDSDDNPDDLAIVASVNGLVAGTARLYVLEGETQFALLLSDELLSPGNNTVELFVIPRDF